VAVPREILRHYAALVESLLPPGGPTFQPTAEDDVSVQVERGRVLPMALAGADADRIDQTLDRLRRDGASRLRVVDAAGHTRPAYPGLLVYAWRRAREILGRNEPCPALDAWRRRLNAVIERTRITSEAGGTLAVDAVVELAWAVRACGRGQETHWASMQTLLGLRPSGAFFPPDPSANPETAWYHELVLLHALAPRLPVRSAANAEYHLNETQPDHATNEPWGLLAFILNPRTHTLADQLLHNVRVHHPGGARGVTAILLADVLDCLRELSRPSG
jgi:hypothetical protein